MPEFLKVIFESVSLSLLYVYFFYLPFLSVVSNSFHILSTFRNPLFAVCQRFSVFIVRFRYLLPTACCFLVSFQLSLSLVTSCFVQRRTASPFHIFAFNLKGVKSRQASEPLHSVDTLFYSALFRQIASWESLEKAVNV